VLTVIVFSPFIILSDCVAEKFRGEALAVRVSEVTFDEIQVGAGQAFDVRQAERVGIGQQACGARIRLAARAHDDTVDRSSHVSGARGAKKSRVRLSQ
jgi:hypothetical protein